MKHIRTNTLIIVAFTVLAGLAVAFPTLAQDVSILEPLVIDVQQEIPVEAAVTIPDGDGGTVSTTIPLTVDVALQVKVQSGQVSLTGPDELPEVSISVAEGPVSTSDLAGIPVEIENRMDVNIVQINSREVLGEFWVEGILMNNSERVLTGAELSATFYDASGEILGFMTGDVGQIGGFETSPPGTMAPFDITSGLESGIEANLVDHYEVEVKPNFE